MTDIINRKALDRPLRRAAWIAAGRPDTGSKPARTREGQTYPGGRQMRRKLKKLALRQGTYVARMPNAKQTHCTFPGSMND